jgi:preprotein translocase subunit SecF
MMDLMGKRYWYFAFSLAIIIPGVIIIFLWGIPLSTDFKGGSLLEAQFASGKTPPPADVIRSYEKMGFLDAEVITSGSDTLEIRSSVIPEGQLNTVLATLSQDFNDTVTARQYDSISPTVAREVVSRGILVIIVASILLTIYIAYAFRGVTNAFRYGVCTVAALLHDILVMLSAAAITGRFFGWEVDTLFLTAVLTVIAFSAQDTIVVFDRIRENITTYRRLPFDKLVNHSVVQTLTRSVNTQMMAVDLLLLAMALFGGITLRKFAVILLVGMLSGSYSSEFNAAPLLIVWENKEWRNWFRRKSNQGQPA